MDWAEEGKRREESMIEEHHRKKSAIIAYERDIKETRRYRAI